MKRDVLLSELALADFDAAFQWYENRRSGLGAEFKEEVQKTLARLADSAEMFEVVHKDKRRAFSKTISIRRVL